jgi:bacillithiol system protein YtxJ
MNWEKLDSLETLELATKESFNQPVLLFKHSTTCSISNTALNRFERKWNDEKAKSLKPYYLDLLKLRPISHEIAQKFNIQHESPQALLIKDGKCIYNASHFDISFDEIVEKI